MTKGLKSMEDILEAFSRPIPVQGGEGALTLPDLLRFLNEAAPGFAIESEVQGEYVNVSLTINWTDENTDSVATVPRYGLAAISGGDVWAAYETALLRSAGLWGLTGRKGDGAVEHLLKGVDLG